MKYWVGTTDNSWFLFLRGMRPDEVNSWQPRGGATYSDLAPGSLFLFKLKRPYNHIAGGAHFVKSTSLPLSMAWDAFGAKNGAATRPAFEALLRKAASYRPIERRRCSGTRTIAIRAASACEATSGPRRFSRRGDGCV